MRSWAFLLGGLLVWTLHFFGLYGFASIFPESAVARVLSGLLTLTCLAALLWLIRRSWTSYRTAGGEVWGWTALLATLINAISTVAVFWQGFPVVLSGP